MRNVAKWCWSCLSRLVSWAKASALALSWNDLTTWHYDGPSYIWWIVIILNCMIISFPLLRNFSWWYTRSRFSYQLIFVVFLNMPFVLNLTKQGISYADFLICLQLLGNRSRNTICSPWNQGDAGMLHQSAPLIFLLEVLTCGTDLV